MSDKEYQEMVKAFKPKESRIKNYILAFFVGGFIGLFSELMVKFLINYFNLSQIESMQITCLFWIFIASLFTMLSKFDDWVKVCKCGLIIPTTGFAHSIASCAIEYKKEGMITGTGSNFFKLAGSVILYGIISAFFLCILKVILLWLA